MTIDKRDTEKRIAAVLAKCCPAFKKVKTEPATALDRSTIIGVCSAATVGGGHDKGLCLCIENLSHQCHIGKWPQLRFVFEEKQAARAEAARLADEVRERIRRAQTEAGGKKA